MRRHPELATILAAGLVLAAAAALAGDETARAQTALANIDENTMGQCIEPAVATEGATCEAPATCEEPVIAIEPTPPACDARRLVWGTPAELVCEDTAALEIANADAMCVEG